MGCCMGTDLRRMICDGVNVKHAFGLDVNPGFFPLGHELFDDGNSPLKQQFFAIDVLRMESDSKSGPSATSTEAKKAEFLQRMERARLAAALDAVHGVDVIYTGSVLHLLTCEQTERFAAAAFQWLKHGHTASEPGLGLFTGRFVCSTRYFVF
jgi:hypothetical protein